tara:strand:+ start:74 stop:379 length:306 start_codon:yes stop_codon:yes gene_type:complete
MDQSTAGLTLPYGPLLELCTKLNIDMPAGITSDSNTEVTINLQVIDETPMTVGRLINVLSRLDSEMEIHRDVEGRGIFELTPSRLEVTSLSDESDPILIIY